ncbi:transposase [Methylacidimicrobium sp. B4]|uniref:transposase n=1 Tax=Methylacidimicrobium sp. B4 TaxID=2796139 RepID=UPI001A8DA03A|nr:transposase [Methylacidimicrobium sp. B4]QSR85430.1 transposase [Methylacidimicrobium sp. B4]
MILTGTALTLRAFPDLFPDEDAARAWFERARWPDGPMCPVCGCVNHASWLRTIRRWECTACHRQFSVTAGTPMHRTHLPMLTWGGVGRTLPYRFLTGTA